MATPVNDNLYGKIISTRVPIENWVKLKEESNEKGISLSELLLLKLYGSNKPVHNETIKGVDNDNPLTLLLNLFEYYEGSGVIALKDTNNDNLDPLFFGISYDDNGNPEITSINIQGYYSDGQTFYTQLDWHKNRFILKHPHSAAKVNDNREEINKLKEVIKLQEEVILKTKKSSITTVYELKKLIKEFAYNTFETREALEFMRDIKEFTDELVDLDERD